MKRVYFNESGFVVGGSRLIELLQKSKTGDVLAKKLVNTCNLKETQEATNVSCGEGMSYASKKGETTILRDKNAIVTVYGTEVEKKTFKRRSFLPANNDCQDVVVIYRINRSRKL